MGARAQSAVGGTPEIVVTAHAAQRMEERGIALPLVLKTVRAGNSRIESKSGNEVFRTGNIRIAAKRDGNRITILTVTFVDDFAEYAGK